LNVFPVIPGLRRLSFSPDGLRLIATATVTAMVYEAATGRSLRELKDPSQDSFAVFPYPTGEGFLVADRTNRLHQGTTNAPAEGVKEYRGEFKSHYMDVVFSPDARDFCALSEIIRPAVHDLQTMQMLMPLPERTYAALFSPEGKRLVTLHRSSLVRIWDLVDFQEILTLRGHREPVINAAFSPDGRFLASVDCSGVVKLWLAHPGRERIKTQGILWGLSQSPDGRLAAVCPIPFGVMLWDMLTGNVLADLRLQRR
jgi:WD40 repeat protein